MVVGAESRLTYDAVGATAEPTMMTSPPVGFRPIERSAMIGAGADFFGAVCAAVLRWDVQRGSGMSIQGAQEVFEGAMVTLLIPFGPLRVRAAAKVVYVIREPRRVGFAYGTLAGHPESGEEAFVVEHRADDSVWIVIRAFSRPARPWLWLGYPVLRATQEVFTRRYLRALVVPRR